MWTIPAEASIPVFHTVRNDSPRSRADCRFSATIDIAAAGLSCYAGRMVRRRQRVVLYGNSLVLAGIRASLVAHPCLDVIALEAPSADAAQELRSLCPAAVIFDIGGVQPDSPFLLGQEQTGLLLIGIDPISHQVLLWSGRHLGEASTQDLVQLIVKTSPDFPVCEGCNP